MGSDLYWEVRNFHPRPTLAFRADKNWEIYVDRAVTGYIKQGEILSKDITLRALKTLGIQVVTTRPV